MDANFNFDNSDSPLLPTSLEELRGQKLEQLYAERNSRLDSFLTLGDGETKRSSGETLIWSVKVAQAKLFQDSGQLEDCPLLEIETKAYLAEEGEELSDGEIWQGVKNLAQRLIAKEPLLQQASAKIVGRAGKKEEMIREAATLEELQSINLAEGWD